MIKDKFAEQILKTGFVLENKIAQQLKNKGWTVISNRYYVDDAEGSVREIDLVAYRVSRAQHFDVYTTLLISCKKSESNAWALLCRNTDLKDPNSNWQPLHAWSNDKAVKYKLTEDNASRKFHDAMNKKGASEALRTSDVEVFAFQEMNKSSGSPQNDRAIFGATTSLMKAQAYELGALSQRLKKPAVYQFNLLSVVDSDLLRLHFTEDTIKTEVIEQEHYIARYIIGKKATFSRIRFIKASAFQSIISDYDTLHKANCSWHSEQYDEFYIDIVKDFKRIAIYIADFRKEVLWNIRLTLNQNRITPPDINDLNFFWNETLDSLLIYANFDATMTQILNSDAKLCKNISKALLKIYRYKGDFKFTEFDIPF